MLDICTTTSVDICLGKSMKYSAVLLSLIISASLNGMFSVEEFEKKKTGKEISAYINQSDISTLDDDQKKTVLLTINKLSPEEYLEFLKNLQRDHPITKLQWKSISLPLFKDFLSDKNVQNQLKTNIVSQLIDKGFLINNSDYQNYFIKNPDELLAVISINPQYLARMINTPDKNLNDYLIHRLIYALHDNKISLEKFKQVVSKLIAVGLDLTVVSSNKDTPLRFYLFWFKDNPDQGTIALLTPKSQAQAKPTRFDFIEFTKIDDGKKSAEYVLSHDLESLKNEERQKLFQLIDALWPGEYYEFLKKLTPNHALTKITSSPINRNTTLSHTATSFLSSMLAQTQTRLNILQALIEKGFSINTSAYTDWFASNPQLLLELIKRNPKNLAQALNEEHSGGRKILHQLIDAFLIIERLKNAEDFKNIIRALRTAGFNMRLTDINNKTPFDYYLKVVKERDKQYDETIAQLLDPDELALPLTEFAQALEQVHSALISIPSIADIELAPY